MTKEIQLTQGKITLVDDADFEWLNQWKWYYGGGYAIRSLPEKTGNITIRMNRLIANTPDGFETDHINRNKLDNQRINLRNCTSTENKRNTSIRANNKTGFKGVSWDKKNMKWRANINFDSKNISLGAFNSPNDAAKAYDDAAQRFFGEFAWLNFPDQEY